MSLYDWSKCYDHHSCVQMIKKTVLPSCAKKDGQTAYLQVDYQCIPGEPAPSVMPRPFCVFGSMWQTLIPTIYKWVCFFVIRYSHINICHFKIIFLHIIKIQLVHKELIIDLHYPFSRKVSSNLSCHSHNSLICTHNWPASLSFSHFCSHNLHTFYSYIQNLNSINLNFLAMIEQTTFIPLLVTIVTMKFLEFIGIVKRFENHNSTW